MRRQIRVQIDLVAVVDDDQDGVPFVADATDVLWDVARAVLPNATGMAPGGRLSVGLTRESLVQARRAWKTAPARPSRLSPIRTTGGEG